jgi:catechol 2,3-dioxygenase-like lactoylglutathione lyase family enzyme
VSVQLNHTIVSCRDQERSAAFLTGILGLPPATRFGPFSVVEAGNGVSLDYRETTGEITAQHLRLPGRGGRVRRRVRPHPRPGRRLLGRSRPDAAR